MELTGLSDAGVRARSKNMKIKPTQLTGKWAGQWWSPEQVERIMAFTPQRTGGMRAGWRKNLPVNHAMQRHGTAAEASLAISAGYANMDAMALLRSISDCLPNNPAAEGLSRCDIPNTTILDIQSLLAKDARDRNKQDRGEEDQ
jgi:hypothetical protein